MARFVKLQVQLVSQGRVEYTDFRLFGDEDAIKDNKPFCTVSYPGKNFDRKFVEQVAAEMDVRLLEGVEKMEDTGWSIRTELYRGFRYEDDENTDPNLGPVTVGKVQL